MSVPVPSRRAGPTADPKGTPGARAIGRRGSRARFAAVPPASRRRRNSPLRAPGPARERFRERLATPSRLGAGGTRELRRETAAAACIIFIIFVLFCTMFYYFCFVYLSLFIYIAPPTCGGGGTRDRRREIDAAAFRLNLLLLLYFVRPRDRPRETVAAAFCLIF